MIQHGETSPIHIDVPEQRDGMKNRWLWVARFKLKSCSKMENFVVTEVFSEISAVHSLMRLDATLFASATVAASHVFSLHRTLRIITLVTPNSVILLACAA
jgi:hypothetical protein